MLTTDTKVKVLLNLASLSFCNFHKSAWTIWIESSEWIVLKDSLVEVRLNELTIVVTAEAECCL